MSDRAFLFFYLLWLAVCVAGVEGARRLSWAPTSVPEASVPAERVTLAVPPKPEVESVAPRAQAQGTGGSVLYDEATCRRYKGDFRDVCFQALARQRAVRDLEGGLLACEEVGRRRLRLECMADVAEYHASTDLEAALAVCPAIEARKWRDQCVFGIAMALVPLDTALALATCDDAGMWRDFCRHDVLGETSVRDLDRVLEICGREEGDLLTRKTCWHGIGKYIGRVDLDRAFEACRRVPPGPGILYRENCFHGAGWAAGERWGVGGAIRCSEAGPQVDSCRVGVAFELKATSPSEAVDVCRTVVRSDLRNHCLDWIGG
ncbi:MAG: hypothetical protein JXB39_07275 [Deltaproteobacteria bacterium]|nr:hypothetical protein [Deltaproteobacteria bacterium]